PSPRSVPPFPVRARTAELRSRRMAGLVAGYAIAGKYRLVSPLGRGAMGEVWRAEHALLRSPLAVKILHPQHLDGSNTDVRALMERFSREARTTGALRSPHVVQILDS